MSDESTIVQELPRPGSGPAIWDLVIEDVRDAAARGRRDARIAERIVADGRARDEMGARKYGQRLQAGDGRDHLVDAYQEALDLVVYLRQDLAEIRASGEGGFDRLVTESLYERAMDLAFWIAGEIEIRAGR